MEMSKSNYTSLPNCTDNVLNIHNTILSLIIRQWIHYVFITHRVGITVGFENATQALLKNKIQTLPHANLGLQ